MLEGYEKGIALFVGVCAFTATTAFLRPPEYEQQEAKTSAAVHSDVLPHDYIPKGAEPEDVPAAEPTESFIVPEGKELKPTKSPNLVKLNGKFYFLFNENVMLPLVAETWKEYPLPEQKGVGMTSEFLSEPQDKWTQKFVMHGPVPNESNCQEFVEKLLTGVIISVEKHLADAKLGKFKPEYLQFSFVDQKENETLMFWHRKDIPKLADQVQFIRCFLTPSKKMYLATITLKMSPDDLNDDEIKYFVGALRQITELKEKNEK